MLHSKYKMTMLSYISIPMKNAYGSYEYLRVDLNDNTVLMKGVDDKYHVLEDFKYLLAEDGESSDCCPCENCECEEDKCSKETCSQNNCMNCECVTPLSQ